MTSSDEDYDNQINVEVVEPEVHQILEQKQIVQKKPFNLREWFREEIVSCIEEWKNIPNFDIVKKCKNVKADEKKKLTFALQIKAYQLVQENMHKDLFFV